MEQLSHIPRQSGSFISQRASSAHKTCLCSKGKTGCSVLSSWSVSGIEIKTGTRWHWWQRNGQALLLSGKHKWTCCNYEWGVLGNNKRIKYFNAVESERTKFGCMRTLRTTREISKYNTPWFCLHETPNMVRRIFSLFLPGFSSSNLCLDSGYWGWHWTVTDYLTFISQWIFCFRA